MSTTERTDRDVVTWLGLGAVGIAAAIMSFTALSELARMCGIVAVIPFAPGPDGVARFTFPVAWLLPVTIDVLAGVSTRVWLQRRVNADALYFARRSAWAAIGATVVGNAAHGALARAAEAAPWWAVVAVSAVPAVALGAMVHLAVLVGRGADEPRTARSRDNRPRPPLRALLARARDNLVEHSRRRAKASGDPVPTSGDSDEVLVADLRRLEAARRADGESLLSRDAVAKRYGVGSERADRVRSAARRPTAVESEQTG